jgi:hypothetical protein
MAATFEHHDNNWVRLLCRALEELDYVIAERNELRREVCEYATAGETIGAALLYADSRGWDCYKNDEEDTNDR